MNSLPMHPKTHLDDQWSNDIDELLQTSINMRKRNKTKIVINLSCSTSGHTQASLAFWPCNIFSGVFQQNLEMPFDFHKQLKKVFLFSKLTSKARVFPCILQHWHVFQSKKVICHYTVISNHSLTVFIVLLLVLCQTIVYRW